MGLQRRAHLRSLMNKKSGLHELAEEKSGTLKVGKVNVDEQMELAMRFQVSSIPMLVVIKDGKAVAKSVGYRPKSEIAAMVEGAR